MADQDTPAPDSRSAPKPGAFTCRVGRGSSGPIADPLCCSGLVQMGWYLLWYNWSGCPGELLLHRQGCLCRHLSFSHGKEWKFSVWKLCQDWSWLLDFFFKGSHESLCISYLTTYAAKVLFGSQVIPEFVKLYLKAAVLKHPFISVFSGSNKGETRMISVVQGN